VGPRRTAGDARDQLGDSVAVYLEAGDTGGDTPSTIVDVSGSLPRVLRQGALGLAELQSVVPELQGPEA
jgi:L-threonylcarbamoyladenylate synthase